MCGQQKKIYRNPHKNRAYENRTEEMKREEDMQKIEQSRGVSTL
jgi:hypothetical protein